MSASNEIKKNIEDAVGLSIEQIKNISPEKFRQFLEQKNKSKTKFVSEFPNIGRGNVLRDNLIDSDELNSEIDKILNIKKPENKKLWGKR